MEEDTSRADIIQEIYLVMCGLMTNEVSHFFNHTEHVLLNKSLNYYALTDSYSLRGG